MLLLQTQTVLYADGFLWTQKDLFAIIGGLELHPFFSYLRQFNKGYHLKPSTVLQLLRQF